MNRRSFLRGAAAAAPLLSAPAVAMSAPSSVQENSTLIDLGARLDQAEAALISAMDYYADALAIGRRLWPRAPVELLEEWQCHPHNDLERTITGEGFPKEAYAGGHRYVRTLECVRETAVRVGQSRGPGSKSRKAQVARILELAEQYAAQKENALRASGFKDADRELNRAVETLERLCHEAHAAEAVTMAGVVIKAQSIRAWGHVPKRYWIVTLNGREAWAPGLAASLLAVMEREDDDVS